MRRREFIELLLLAATGWPPTASAQTSQHMSLIAVLMRYGEGEVSDPKRRAFQQALRDLSWISGRNVRIEYRLAGGDFWAAAQFGERGGQAPTRRDRGP